MSQIDRAFQAANQGDDQSLAQLLDRGLSPDSVDADGDCLLEVAAIKGQLKCVKLLLERGAKPNGPQDDGSPLWNASYRPNNADCIREIIAHGGDPNLTRYQEERHTMLMHCAASPEFKRNLAELLKHSPILDARNNEDESPISYACAYGNLRAVRMLLEAGVDPNAPVCKGATVLTVALTSHNRMTNAIVDCLIESGADVNIPNARDESLTPEKNLLMLAVSYRPPNPANVAMAKKIASLTRDLNYEVDGSTALSMARMQGYTEYVELLKELGAADE